MVFGSRADYEAIRVRVEASGKFTTLRLDDDAPMGILDLVCASAQNERGLCGVSFKINLWDGRWYLSTWLPVYYRVAADADVAEICLSLLAVGGGAPFRFPADHVRRLGLIELVDAEIPSELRG